MLVGNKFKVKRLGGKGKVEGDLRPHSDRIYSPEDISRLRQPDGVDEAHYTRDNRAVCYQPKGMSFLRG